MEKLFRLLFASRWPYCLLRTAIAIVFIWAGLGKLISPKAFARVVSGYGLVPDELLVPFAIGLPALELLVGIGLLFDIRGSLRVIFGLLLVFLTALGFAILKDLDVDCGCFSLEELDARSSLRVAFLRDIGLVCAVSYLLAWKGLRRRTGGDFHPGMIRTGEKRI